VWLALFAAKDQARTPLRDAGGAGRCAGGAATHKHAPACEQSVRLLRLVHEPWDVLRRHVRPRSFREHTSRR